jgi:hypothetical protein
MRWIEGVLEIKPTSEFRIANLIALKALSRVPSSPSGTFFSIALPASHV